MDLISIERESGLSFRIRARRHEVASDMSPEDGGRGDGFTPSELLASSLGACIAMSVQRYCAECGHGDGDVSVSLTFQLRDDPRRIGSIVVDVELPPGVPDDRLEAIRRVAEHCVVHRTLERSPQVDMDIIQSRSPTAGPVTNEARPAKVRRI